MIVLIQNKTIIHLKNQNQHNLLNKIKIMSNKVKKEVIVIHGENRIIMKNQHNLLNKNNTRKWNKITNNIVYQKTKYYIKFQSIINIIATLNYIVHP